MVSAVLWEVKKKALCPLLEKREEKEAKAEDNSAQEPSITFKVAKDSQKELENS